MKEISNRCCDCRRQRQLNIQPQKSDLPSYQFSVKPGVFKRTGVDFFGPFEIYSQINTAMKAYCCLFICLLIRAFHIEATRNLQKESCIMTFQGFISRGGVPERIHSDNALFCTSKAKKLRGKRLHNYRDPDKCGVEKECTEIDSTRSTTFWWILGTPHWDEQMTPLQYRRTKETQGRHFINHYRQVEALLHSRPLTSISRDIGDVESLTPGDSLRGMTRGLPSDTTISSSHRETGKLWNNVNSIMNKFWTRLLKEYLPTLRQHRKLPSTLDAMQVADMMWILENNTPRGVWPLRRVQKVNNGKDNVVRSWLKHQKGNLLNQLSN